MNVPKAQVNALTPDRQPWSPQKWASVCILTGILMVMGIPFGYFAWRASQEFALERARVDQKDPLRFVNPCLETAR